MLRRIVPAAVIGIALLSAGCTHTDAPSAAPSAPASTSSPAGAASTAGADLVPDHYDAARDPAADLKTALALAASDGKEVLIDFGADWCPDCQVLDKLFHSDPTMSLLRRDFHVVVVDVGQFDRNLDFAATYVDLQTSGIPALVVLTPSGTVRVATNDGSFANARTMDNDQVDAFLTRWAAKS